MQSTDPNILKDLVRQEMPYGKYKGRKLCDLPTYYLEWFASKGFPKGRLGMQLATVFEIKTNGLEEILYQIKKMQ